jgi:hypothetical protein
VYVTGESEKVKAWSVARKKRKEGTLKLWKGSLEAARGKKIRWYGMLWHAAAEELSKSNITEQLGSIGFDQNGGGGELREILFVLFD